MSLVYLVAQHQHIKINNHLSRALTFIIQVLFIVDYIVLLILAEISHHVKGLLSYK